MGLPTAFELSLTNTLSQKALPPSLCGIARAARNLVLVVWATDCQINRKDPTLHSAHETACVNDNVMRCLKSRMTRLCRIIAQHA
jgi:hypothetical protein